VLERRSNLDFDGTPIGSDWLDRSMTFDAVNNRLSLRVQVDSNPADDLKTFWAYNANDLPIVTQQPEGNRSFTIYDERLLPFKTFYGVAPGSTITEGYPAQKQATDLGGAAFVGYTQHDYDARGNLMQSRDGRGFLTTRFYDFRNRMIATSDPNGDGQTMEYDDASNVLTTHAGAVDPNTGAMTSVLSRTYSRFDEAGRRFQTVLDINPASNESALVDPAVGGNSSFRTFLRSRLARGRQQ